MKDTRLLQVREMGQDCKRILDELIEENIDSPQELRAVLRGAMAAAELIEAMSIYEPEEVTR